MAASPQLAFVTLVTSDSYLPGALVVAAALQDLHPSPPIYPDEYDPSEFHRVCLITPETLDVNTMKHLRRAFDVVIGVEVIEEDTEEGLTLLGRLDLRTVLTKLHVFRLISYRKLIFLDADILPLRPISHLFRISASFAAVPDVGWPDIFNSGFFVLEPSEEKFKDVMDVVKSKGSWDGGDQGVLNEWLGQDWERLSFTYNTTPTAVYTYAPAYKRFGSQISNIHFIGPNKPWLQIPLRTPGTSSASSPPASLPSQDFEPPPSYGYPALLDRWFAVYDKRYRSVPTTLENVPTTSDESPSTHTDVHITQRYKNVWNSDAQSNGKADTSGVGAPLGLEELRRLAIEGVGDSETGGGEGTYRALPLEGRIHLMHPPKVKPVSEDRPPLAVKITPAEEAEGPQTPVRSFTRMTTLPTPGPHELPPTPVIRGHSLPPETPTHARPGVQDLFYATPDHERLQPQIQRSSPLLDLRSRSMSPGHSVPPLRHASPPLVSWNPAVEAPPSIPPPASRFPEDTYFPNAWDAQSRDQPVPEDNGGLFPVPSAPSIPETLINDGLYQAVIGRPRPEEPPRYDEEIQQQDPPSPEAQSTQDSHPVHQPTHPQPDRSKVATVFPWEEKPRHAPVRFYPRTDSPPPGHPFIQPHTPALKLNLPPPPGRVPPPTSLPGFPRTTTYANAWDVVPSIQRYASRLAGRPAPLPARLTPDIGPTRKRGGATANVDEYRSWQDMVEVSSRDADDEDEDEDEDGSSPNHGGRSGRSEKTGERRSYRGRGVQTVPKHTKNQSVQVPNTGGKQVTWSASQSTVPELSPTARVVASGTSVVDAKLEKEAISPPSSTGPLSPPEGAPVRPGTQLNAAPGPRPVGRTFDPARGVEVFKKGSEEVLAKFLKIGSWEEDTATGTGSPSVI
ncbi:hypothetical protein JB92DRAFT_1705884 [Gautieria morchelliformis]|nr:hypothetical protein JB92DRAFT_1705884 [Gautieria morchelliformis]